MADVHFGKMKTLANLGSPTLTVEETEDGVLLRAADKNGITEATVRNGQNGADGQKGLDGAPGTAGKDGFSPIATVEPTPNGALIVITDKNGSTEAEVLNGESLRWEDLTPEQKDSLKGADGYTPVKGVDYFTDAEINVIKDDAKAHADAGDAALQEQIDAVSTQGRLYDFNVSVDLTLEPVTSDAAAAKVDIPLPTDLEDKWKIEAIGKWECYNGSTRIDGILCYGFSMNQQKTFRCGIRTSGTHSKRIDKVQGALLLIRR